MFEQGLEVGRERVEVVAVQRLRRLAEPAPVVRDHAISSFDQCGRLLLPHAPAERPAVDEHDGCAGTVVGVVQVDRRSVLFADADVWHATSFSVEFVTGSAKPALVASRGGTVGLPPPDGVNGETLAAQILGPSAAPFNSLSEKCGVETPSPTQPPRLCAQASSAHGLFARAVLALYDQAAARGWDELDYPVIARLRTR